MVIYVGCKGDKTQIRLISSLIADHGHVPIAPELYFPQFFHGDDSEMRETLLSFCDEIWVLGTMADQASWECIPIQYFASISAMTEHLEAASSNDGVKPPRTFEQLMDELLMVSGSEPKGDIVDKVCAEARVLELRTHIHRGTLETILFRYNSLLCDMKKMEMTEEEEEILLRGAIDSLADHLNLDILLVTMVILLECKVKGVVGIKEAISDFCDEKARAITRTIGVDRELAEKIITLSNRWQWRERADSKEYPVWRREHISRIAEELSIPEDVVTTVIRATIEGASTE